MTREEIIIEIRNGAKAKHQYFTDNEYIHWKNGEIQTEDGYNFGYKFWSEKIFESGWSVVS